MADLAEKAQDAYLHFTFREVSEALVRAAGIKDGEWGIVIKFGFRATNMVPPDRPGEMTPAAVIPLLEIGLQKFDKPNSLSVDASEITRKTKARPRSPRIRKVTP